MKLRAWLNNDPKSNEMITYIVPKGTNLGRKVMCKVRNYTVARKAHVTQLSDEVVALNLICNKHGLYNDMFILLRDKYIFRPVEKAKQTKKQSSNQYQATVSEKIAALVLIFGFLLAITAMVVIPYIAVVSPVIRAIKNNKI